MRLSDGGAKLEINRTVVASNEKDLNTIVSEYARLYHKMAALITDGISDVDLAPLRHVADVFILGQRIIVAPFIT
jgi:D-galactose 1-dehydrogenase